MRSDEHSSMSHSMFGRRGIVESNAAHHLLSVDIAVDIRSSGETVVMIDTLSNDRTSCLDSLVVVWSSDVEGAYFARLKGLVGRTDVDVETGRDVSDGGAPRADDEACSKEGDAEDGASCVV
jgi:hypothetical protein